MAATGRGSEAAICLLLKNGADVSQKSAVRQSV